MRNLIFLFVVVSSLTAKANETARAKETYVAVVQKAITESIKSDPKDFAAKAEEKLADRKYVSMELSKYGLAPASVVLGQVLIRGITRLEILAVFEMIIGSSAGRIARTIATSIIGQRVQDMFTKVVPLGTVAEGSGKLMFALGHLLNTVPFVIAGYRAYKADDEKLRDRTRMDVFADSLIDQGTFGIVPGIADTRAKVQKSLVVLAQDPSTSGSYLAYMYQQEQEAARKKARAVGP